MKMALGRAARDSPLGSSCRLGCFVFVTQKGKGSSLKGLPLFGGENDNRAPGCCPGTAQCGLGHTVALT